MSGGYNRHSSTRGRGKELGVMSYRGEASSRERKERKERKERRERKDR